MTETIADSKLYIPGIGHVLIGEVDATPPVPDQFVFGDPITYGGSSWIGDTSAENLPEFETDGGDPTPLRTFDRKGVRTVYDDKTITGTIGLLNINADSLALAFPGGQQLGNEYQVMDNGQASARSMTILIEDATAKLALYFPNVAIVGKFPTFDLEQFLEVPLTVTVLSSPKKPGHIYSWIAEAGAITTMQANIAGGATSQTTEPTA